MGLTWRPDSFVDIQFKNGKYSVAHENYQKAIEKAEICALEVYQRAKVTQNLDEADAEMNYIVNDEFQSFKAIHAHRNY